MNLALERIYGKDSTEGDLFLSGIYECFTLERPRFVDGQENVHQKTCIPEGRYQIVLYKSPRHGCMKPLLLNVPGRDGIEIDVANQPSELLGCIAVGMTKGIDWVGASQRAYDALMTKLQPVFDRGEEVWITITQKEA